MRFLPVFLDLQSGVVLLVGAGDLVRAKLRLLVSAGAQVRWFATDGNHDLSGLEIDAARIELAQGDPLDGRSRRRHRDPLRGRRRHRRCDVSARQGGRSARQCDGRSRPIRLSFSPPSSIAAMSSSLLAPAAHRRSSRAGCASASRRSCPRGSAISPVSSAVSVNRCIRASPNFRCAAASGNA